MGDDCEYTHPKHVFFYIVGIEEALAHEKPHDRCSDSADKVQCNGYWMKRKAGENQIRDMINSHGKNCNEFQVIGIQFAQDENLLVYLLDSLY